MMPTIELETIVSEGVGRRACERAFSVAQLLSVPRGRPHRPDMWPGRGHHQ